jgi:hypothetical protein
LFHLRRDHLALNFGQDLLAFLEAQAQGCERDFLGPLPGGDINFDMFAGAISAINFSFQFKGVSVCHDVSVTGPGWPARRDAHAFYGPVSADRGRRKSAEAWRGAAKAKHRQNEANYQLPGWGPNESIKWGQAGLAKSSQRRELLVRK